MVGAERLRSKQKPLKTHITESHADCASRALEVLLLLTDEEQNQSHLCVFLMFTRLPTHHNVYNLYTPWRRSVETFLVQKSTGPDTAVENPGRPDTVDAEPVAGIGSTRLLFPTGWAPAKLGPRQWGSPGADVRSSRSS